MTLSFSCPDAALMIKMAAFHPILELLGYLDLSA